MTVYERIHAKCEQAKSRIDSERGRIPGGVPSREDAPAEPAHEPWPVSANSVSAKHKVMEQL